MNAKVHRIEVDGDVAARLEARAAALGMSVADLLAAIAGNQGTSPPDGAPLRANGERPLPPEAVADDARAAAEFDRARMGMRWGEVKAWIDSWGKPNELPRPKLGKL